MAPCAPHLVRDELHAELHRLAARYPLFDPVRFPALALTIGTYLPTARPDDRALAALVSLWIIAFDALVDEGDAPTLTLAALVARYGAILDGDGAAGASTNPPRPAGAAGQLDAALREIGARLVEYHPPPALLAWWKGSCRATIAAIVRQRDLGRAGGPVPGYGDILPLLVDSIGVRPYLAVGVIAGGEPGLAERLPAVAALASECALAIRLANDLRTWGKDEQEGGINTLVALRGDLTRAQPGLYPAAAREIALSTLAERLAESHARCHARLVAPGGGGKTEAGMVRLVDVVVGVYAAHDYHTYPATGG